MDGCVCFGRNFFDAIGCRWLIQLKTVALVAMAAQVGLAFREGKSLSTMFRVSTVLAL